MRLSNQEINSIKKAFKEVFGDGEIFLFGSRVDDSKKGGDIDLYIQSNYTLDTKQMLDKKIKFKLALYDKIGEQKIDVIISKDKDSSIEKEALQTGIPL